MTVSDLLKDYGSLHIEIKERIRNAQYQALRTVNKELIDLYWDISGMIVERQAGDAWGKSVVEQLASDLQQESPGVGDFSASNLWRMKSFFETYAGSEKLAQLVRKIGWSHNLVIMSRCNEKSCTITEYALQSSTSPIGIATYRTVRELPEELKGELPDPEEIARLLEGSG